MKPQRKTKRPIKENLLRQLALAREYLERLYELEQDGCGCGPQILRTQKEVETLERLTK